MKDLLKLIATLIPMLALAYNSSASEEHFKHWQNVTQGGPNFPVNTVNFANDRYFALGGSTTIASSFDGENWTVHHAGGSLSESMQAIAYGNNVYVATGLSGTIYISNDGCSWRKVYSGTGWPLGSIIFENGKFIAVGNFTIITSVDGENWNLQSREEWLGNIAYGNGVFVISAGMGGQQVAYSLVSTNGTTWEKIELLNETFSDVYFGNGIFVTVSPNLDTQKSYTSTDGKIWTQHTQQFDGYNLHMKMFDGKHFAVAGSGGFYGISKDGVKWQYVEGFESRTLSICAGPEGLLSYDFSGPIKRFDSATRYPTSDISDIGTIDRFKESGDRLYAFANSPGATAVESAPYAMSTTNGIDWYIEMVTDPSNPVIDFFKTNTSEFAITKNGEIYRKVIGSGWNLVFENSEITFERIYANNETILAFGALRTDAQYKKLLTSADGTNWTEIESFPDNYRINDFIYQEGIFIGVGNDLHSGLPIVLTSNSGSTWTNQLDNITNRQDLAKIAYGNGVFLASGNNLLLRSEDGQEWEHIDAEQAQSSGSLTFNGKQFIRTHHNGSYTTSSNGTIWQNRDALTGKKIHRLASVSGRTIAVGENIFGFLHTDNLTTWKQRPSFPDGSIINLVKGHAGFVALEADGLMVHSPDGNTWQTVATPRFLRAAGLAYGNGKYVVLGSFVYNNYGPSSSSEDGINWTVSDDLDGNHKSEVAFVNGHFVALGSRFYSTSNDGHNWTIKENFPYTFRNVIYAQGIYLAAGFSPEGNAALFSSSDEETWTLVHESNKTSNYDTYETLAYGNGRFVAIARYSDIVYSDLGINWNYAPSASPGHFEGLAFGNGYFYSSSGEGQSYLSGDGINWTRSTDNISSRISNVSFLDETFWAYGLNGNIFRLAPSELIEPPTRQHTRALIVSDHTSFDLDIVAQLYPYLNTNSIKIANNPVAREGTITLATRGAPCEIGGSTLLYTPTSAIGIGDTDTVTYRIRSLEGVVGEESQLDLTMAHPAQTRNRINIGMEADIDTVFIKLPIKEENSVQYIISKPNHGIVTFQERSLWYTPKTSNNGTTLDDQFTISLTNYENDRTTKAPFDVIEIAIQRTNRILAEDDIHSLKQGVPSDIDVLSNDLWTASSPIKSISIKTSPKFGQIEIRDNNSPLDLSDDMFRYTPNGNHIGPDSLSYQIVDSEGRSSIATVRILTASLTSYEEWKNTKFDDINEKISDMFYDQETDGITNLHRYAFGLNSNPSSNDSLPLFRPKVRPGGALIFESKLTLDPFVSYTVETLSPGEIWVELESDKSYDLILDDETNHSQALVKILFSVSNPNYDTSSFFRLRVAHAFEINPQN